MPQQIDFGLYGGVQSVATHDELLEFVQPWP